ncbi:MAG: hypothetical protein JWR83_428 [Aeromicrobium sp.]|nr:hypothetical protein [Aeromicrobium sp.]
MSNTKLVVDVTNASDHACVLPSTPPTLAGVGADGTQIALPSNGDSTYFGAPPSLNGPLPPGSTAVVWVGGGQPGVCDPLDATQTWNGMVLGLPDGGTIPFTTAFDTKCGVEITNFGTPAAPTGPPAATTIPPAPASNAPAGLAPCSNANLTLTVSPLGEPSAGQQQAQITFTNTGTTDCTLDGHPGVSVTDDAGNQIGASALRTDVPTPTASLRANGGTAVASLDNLYQTVYDDGCGPQQATMMKVYPPDQTVALSTPFAITVCSNTDLGQLTVDVVKPST